MMEYCESIMRDKIILSEANFIAYTMKCYDNPHCIDTKEFYDDLKRIKYIKRLLNRYLYTGELKERHILNHIILFYNVFGVESSTKMLFYKLDPTLWSSLKTFLLYLNYMPDYITGISESPIISSDIPINMNIANVLRNIRNAAI